MHFGTGSSNLAASAARTKRRAAKLDTRDMKMRRSFQIVCVSPLRSCSPARARTNRGRRRPRGNAGRCLMTRPNNGDWGGWGRGGGGGSFFFWGDVSKVAAAPGSASERLADGRVRMQASTATTLRGRTRGGRGHSRWEEQAATERIPLPKHRAIRGLPGLLLACASTAGPAIECQTNDTCMSRRFPLPPGDPTPVRGFSGAKTSARSGHFAIQRARVQGGVQEQRELQHRRVLGRSRSVECVPSRKTTRARAQVLRRGSYLSPWPARPGQMHRAGRVPRSTEVRHGHQRLDCGWRSVCSSGQCNGTNAPPNAQACAEPGFTCCGTRFATPSETQLCGDCGSRDGADQFCCTDRCTDDRAGQHRPRARRNLLLR